MSRAPDLRTERQATDERDATLDKAVDGSRKGLDDTIVVPHLADIHRRLVNSIEEMCAPLRVTEDGASGRAATFGQRLRSLQAHLPSIADDTVPIVYVEEITRADARRDRQPSPPGDGTPP